MKINLCYVYKSGEENGLGEQNLKYSSEGEMSPAAHPHITGEGTSSQWVIAHGAVSEHSTAALHGEGAVPQPAPSPFSTHLLRSCHFKT